MKVTSQIRSLTCFTPTFSRKDLAHIDLPALPANAPADMPLFLLTAFAKNERTDLSQKERNDFRALTKTLVESYRRQKP